MIRTVRRAAVSCSFLLAGCAVGPAPVAMEVMTQPARSSSTAPRVEIRGRFVKLTGFPCHRSDPYVGGETVTFLGSDGSRTTIVTRSADWIGLPADPPEAPLGQCRQVARFEAALPTADLYVVVINDRRLPPVTLAQLRARGMRYTFRLPS